MCGREPTFFPELCGWTAESIYSKFTQRTTVSLPSSFGKPQGPGLPSKSTSRRKNKARREEWHHRAEQRWFSPLRNLVAGKDKGRLTYALWKSEAYKPSQRSRTRNGSDGETHHKLHLPQGVEHLTIAMIRPTEQASHVFSVRCRVPEQHTLLHHSTYVRSHLPFPQQFALQSSFFS